MARRKPLPGPGLDPQLIGEDGVVAESEVVTWLDPEAAFHDASFYEQAGPIVPEIYLANFRRQVDAVRQQPERHGFNPDLLTFRDVLDRLGAQEGRLDEQDFGFLERQMLDPKGTFKVLASLVLSKVQDDRHVGGLVRLATSESELRRNVLVPLCKVALGGSRDAWEGLKRCAVDGSPLVRSTLAETMGRCGLGEHPEGRKILDSLALDPVQMVRAGAQKAEGVVQEKDIEGQWPDARHATLFAMDEWGSNCVVNIVDLEKMTLKTEIGTAESAGDASYQATLSGLYAEIQAFLEQTAAEQERIRRAQGLVVLHGPEDLKPFEALLAAGSVENRDLQFMEILGREPSRESAILLLKDGLLRHLERVEEAAAGGDLAAQEEEAKKVSDYLLLLQEASVPQDVVDAWIREAGLAGPQDGGLEPPAVENEPEAAANESVAEPARVTPPLEIRLDAEADAEERSRRERLRLVNAQIADVEASLDGMGRLGGEKARELQARLLRLLDEKGRLGHDMGLTVQPLVRSLPSRNAVEVEVKTLVGLTSKECGTGHEEGIRQGIARILEYGGQAALNGLMVLARDGAPEVRTVLLESVGTCRHMDVLPVIGYLMSHPEHYAGTAAAIANLGRLRLTGKDAMALAMQASYVSDERVRANAANALCVQPGREAERRLHELLKDDSNQVRQSAFYAGVVRLQEMGTTAGDAIETYRLLKDPKLKAVYFEYIKSHPASEALTFVLELTRSPVAEDVLLGISGLHARSDPEGRKRLKEMSFTVTDPVLKAAVQRALEQHRNGLRFNIHEALRAQQAKTTNLVKSWFGFIFRKAIRPGRA